MRNLAFSDLCSEAGVPSLGATTSYVQRWADCSNHAADV